MSRVWLKYPTALRAFVLDELAKERKPLAIAGDVRARWPEYLDFGARNVSQLQGNSRRVEARRKPDVGAVVIGPGQGNRTPRRVSLGGPLWSRVERWQA